jgi:AbrB family looped-hinge helix DNA binding protein
MYTTVTGKNQVTIPAGLARQLNIKPGTRLDWKIVDENTLQVRPLPSRGDLADQLQGYGRQWLKTCDNPIQELIDTRCHDDIDDNML